MSLKQSADLTMQQETPFIIFNDMACWVFSAINFLAETSSLLSPVFVLAVQDAEASTAGNTSKLSHMNTD